MEIVNYGAFAVLRLPSGTLIEGRRRQTGNDEMTPAEALEIMRRWESFPALVAALQQANDVLTLLAIAGRLSTEQWSDTQQAIHSALKSAQPEAKQE